MNVPHAPERLGVGLALAIAVSGFGSPTPTMQAPPPAWAGWARCEIQVQGTGYSEQQTHTWTMTGDAPSSEGAFRVYAGTWNVVGKGSLQRSQGSQSLVAEWAINATRPAPLAVFVRASDGRMFIQARHAQLRQAGAIAGYQQQIIDGKPQSPGKIGAEAFEWAFPVIDAAATSTTVNGSSTPAVNGSVGYMQQGGARGSASCTWQFGQGAAAPAPPPQLEAVSIPVPGTNGAGPRRR